MIVRLCSVCKTAELKESDEPRVRHYTVVTPRSVTVHLEVSANDTDPDVCLDCLWKELDAYRAALRSDQMGEADGSLP